MDKHYLIDGYNLIFAIYDDEKPLESMREELLFALEKISSILNLHITLVFDASVGGCEQRSHFGHLEVIFSNGFKNADDYLISFLRRVHHPKHCLVVTSDRQLTHRARIEGAYTEETHHFWRRLERLAEQKRRKQKPLPHPLKRSLPPPTSPKKEKPDEDATFEECFDYYLETFERDLPPKGL